MLCHLRFRPGCEGLQVGVLRKMPGLLIGYRSPNNLCLRLTVPILLNDLSIPTVESVSARPVVWPESQGEREAKERGDGEGIAYWSLQPYFALLM